MQRCVYEYAYAYVRLCVCVCVCVCVGGGGGGGGGVKWLSYLEYISEQCAMSSIKTDT